MRRIEPAFPDLLPLTHRLGPFPETTGDVRLDPVEMRLIWRFGPPRRAGERAVPRRPVRFLAHSAAVRSERDYLARLIGAGCGALVVADDDLEPTDLPVPEHSGQVVVVEPWLPALWGGRPLAGLRRWRERGFDAGVLLALCPSPDMHRLLGTVLHKARTSGASFVLALPLSLPAEDRHRVYDAHAGEKGDGSLEDLLFHTDLSHYALELEREVTRICTRECLSEVLPGPTTSAADGAAFGACSAMFLWARRLDLLDGVDSVGWQLRRAARALLASGRDPRVLVTEDNLRIVPGFSPWVEAFARSLWAGGGEPYEEHLARWTTE